MKKIGIITIHNSPNYGACLQSFALYKYLELQGYPVEIIDLHRPYYDDYVPSSRFLPFDHYPKSIKQKLKEWVKGLLKKDVKDTVKVKEKKDNSESKKKFDAFNAQIHLSRPYLSIDDLYDNPPVYQVSGYSYYNSHGTFVVVGPSMRTMPDASVYNNLSYKG